LQPIERQRQTLFDITESDIEQIFGRMYTSKSRERRKGAPPERQVPELPVVPGARVPLPKSITPVTPPPVPLAIPVPPPDLKAGFAVSAGALAQFGKISTDKIDDIYDAQGCIKDLGRFLLDPEAVNAFEQIIKSREVNALVNRLSQEQNALLERLQSYMHQQHAVIATLVVGRDNLVLNARFRSESFSEDIAQWALCAYINSKTAAQLLNSKQLYHIILSNARGDVIISDLGQTFLITVTDKQDPVDREALMAKLETLLDSQG
jgi:predicted regulator of Ras-like GTPase activity (Roadblock/LC7/MglB family)